jgi:hypothetical protein
MRARKLAINTKIVYSERTKWFTANEENGLQNGLRTKMFLL